MLRNYFLVMLRYFGKRKLYASINLLGLAVGMAVCLLLVLYIQEETGYDEFHANSNRIYRLALERKYPGRSAFLGEIPHSIGGVVQKEFPEVETSVRMELILNGTFTIGDKSYWGKGYGKDAINTLLDYAFRLRNVRRVYLTVNGPNERAIRAYKACGFIEEGRLRRHAWSNGQYIDILYMGVMREEWEALTPKP